MLIFCLGRIDPSILFSVLRGINYVTVDHEKVDRGS